MLNLNVPRNLTWKDGPEHFALPFEDSDAFDLDVSFQAKFQEFSGKHLIAGSYEDPNDPPFAILRRISNFTKIYIFKYYVSKDFVFKACFLGDFDESTNEVSSLNREYFIVSPRDHIEGLSRQETNKVADRVIASFRRQVCFSPERVEFVECNGFTFRYSQISSESSNVLRA